jgi:hypothetical protein
MHEPMMQRHLVCGCSRKYTYWNRVPRDLLEKAGTELPWKQDRSRHSFILSLHVLILETVFLHYCSLLLITVHCYSSLLITALTAHHYSSLLITARHCSLLLITTYHHSWYHLKELCVHSKSQSPSDDASQVIMLRDRDRVMNRKTKETRDKSYAFWLCSGFGISSPLAHAIWVGGLGTCNMRPWTNGQPWRNELARHLFFVGKQLQ